MSTPSNLEIIQQLISPHIAKRDTAVWFANMAEAIKLGLVSVQDLRINMHVTKGTDELRVEFDAFCCDGPAEKQAPPPVNALAACTLTRGCWLEDGHEGHCD